MKIVVAMDKFKGSLDARRACEIVAQALKEIRPGDEVVVRPMADGGEGTADALMASLAGSWIEQDVMGPLPDTKVRAGYAWFPEQKLCAVEMAKASGLTLLSASQRNPLRTTTYGAGELLALAFKHNVPVLLAVGGSATVDGGVGAARALGWKFLDEKGRDVGHGGGELAQIRRIVPPARTNFPSVEVLCDVTNPLLGERGAARVFGPQKGATPADVERLEAGLRNLSGCIQKDLGTDVAALAGGGAAGGLAAGAAAFCGARLVSGASTVAQAIGLDIALKGADWVITGEGRFDETSLSGKVVSGVMAAVGRAGSRILIVAGQSVMSESAWRSAGIKQVLTLQSSGIPESESILRAADLLGARVRAWARGL